MAPTHTALVAHQGGWDEILLVVGPIALVCGLLLLARKRVLGGATPTPKDDTPAT